MEEPQILHIVTEGKVGMLNDQPSQILFVMSTESMMDKQLNGGENNGTATATTTTTTN